jgi:hypothetical protein
MHPKTNLCQKCNGTGWYPYDENHHKACEACCDHAKGWWLLTEGFAGYIDGDDNRCCKAGCGTLARDLEREENAG